MSDGCGFLGGAKLGAAELVRQHSRPCHEFPLVAFVVTGRVYARRDQAQSGDAAVTFIMNRRGETVREVVGDAVERKETLVVSG